MSFELSFKIVRMDCCAARILVYPKQKMPSICPVCKSKQCDVLIVGYAVRSTEHSYIQMSFGIDNPSAKV